MTETWHITAYGQVTSDALCGHHLYGSHWAYTGFRRDKRHRWCQKCLDLEPLYELAATDLGDEESKDPGGGVTHIAHDDAGARLYCGLKLNWLTWTKRLHEFKAGPPPGHWSGPLWCTGCLRNRPR